MQQIPSAGKRKPRNARAVVMEDILGRVRAGVPLLPGYAAPLNATEPVALIRRTLDTIGRTSDTEPTAFTDGCSRLLQHAVHPGRGRRHGLSTPERRCIGGPE